MTEVLIVYLNKTKFSGSNTLKNAIVIVWGRGREKRRIVVVGVRLATDVYLHHPDGVIGRTTQVYTTQGWVEVPFIQG